MRPSVELKEGKVYECFQCGSRTHTTSESGGCPRCGSEVQNLGQSRDL